MVIGITGPIGSGKSYICSKFKQFEKFDIDSFAKNCAKTYKEEFDFIFNYHGLKDSQIEYPKIFTNKKLYRDYMLLIYDYIKKELDKQSFNKNIIVEGVNIYYLKSSLDLIIFVKTPLLKRLVRLFKRDHKRHKLSYILKKVISQRNLIKYYNNDVSCTEYGKYISEVPVTYIKN